MRVGEWDATLIEMSGYEVPPGPTLLFPPDEPPQVPVRMVLNIMLLQGHGQVVLVDPGTGVIEDWFPAMQNVLALGDALGRHGVTHDQVDLVISTHLDPDHAGGLVLGTWPDGLRPAFPNARVVMLEPEVRRYRERDPQAPRNAGTPVLAALENAGVVDMLSIDGGEVAPGVTVRLASGHSPGHASVKVEGDPSLVFIADAAHTTLHVERPELGNADQDIADALATRRRLLGEIADQGSLSWGAHIPGPEAAFVERAGDGFRWQRVG
jgi:glyoxylase-like metal-dependent hydrolase (beta-lactamase superfamily II)